MPFLHSCLIEPVSACHLPCLDLRLLEMNRWRHCLVVFMRPSDPETISHFVHQVQYSWPLPSLKQWIPCYCRVASNLASSFSQRGPSDDRQQPQHLHFAHHSSHSGHSLDSLRTSTICCLGTYCLRKCYYEAAFADLSTRAVSADWPRSWSYFSICPLPGLR